MTVFHSTGRRTTLATRTNALQEHFKAKRTSAELAILPVNFALTSKHVQSAIPKLPNGTFTKALVLKNASMATHLLTTSVSSARHLVLPVTLDLSILALLATTQAQNNSCMVSNASASVLLTQLSTSRRKVAWVVSRAVHFATTKTLRYASSVPLDCHYSTTIA